MALFDFVVLQCTGTNAATETETAGSVNFLSADVPLGDPATYPVAKPEAPTDDPNYSFELWLRLECTIAPDNYVQNIKVWGPGQQPDSPNNKVAVFIGTTDTGATPSFNESTVAVDQVDTAHYQEGNALAIPCATADDKIDAEGEQSDFVVLQLQVEYGALSGEIDLQTFSISYEEV